MIEKYRAETEKTAKDIPVLQEIVASGWRRENELKDLKTELAALDRKIHLSLTPIEKSEDTHKAEPAEIEIHKAPCVPVASITPNVPNVPIVPLVPNVPACGERSRTVPNVPQDDHAKQIEIIQNLFTGKYNPCDFKPNPVPERLQQAKDAMNDRLIIASIPKYHPDNQSKGIKI